MSFVFLSLTALAGIEVKACRDHRGRFASCGSGRGGGGARTTGPAHGGAKPAAKPTTPARSRTMPDGGHPAASVDLIPPSHPSRLAAKPETVTPPRPTAPAKPAASAAPVAAPKPAPAPASPAAPLRAPRVLSEEHRRKKAAHLARAAKLDLLKARTEHYRAMTEELRKPAARMDTARTTALAARVDHLTRRHERLKAVAEGRQYHANLVPGAKPKTRGKKS
jgi:hypothetical protein